MGKNNAVIVILLALDVQKESGVLAHLHHAAAAKLGKQLKKHRPVNFHLAALTAVLDVGTKVMNSP